MKSEHIKDLIDESDLQKQKLDRAIFTGVRSVSVLDSDAFGTVYVFEEESQEFWPSYLILNQTEFDWFIGQLETLLASDERELPMDTVRCTYGDILGFSKESVLFFVKVVKITCNCDGERWSMIINRETAIKALKTAVELAKRKA